MGKLHEVLAVEDSLATTAKSITDEAIKTFKGKDHLFRGQTIEQRPLVENADGSTSLVDEITETQQVVETVPGKLRHVAEHWAAYVNASAQKEIANTQAKADLTIDGDVMFGNAPATLLLSLESKLKNFRNAVAAAPTMDMAKTWTNGDGDIYVAQPEVRKIAQKMERSEVVIQPTEHQPGQYRTYTEAVNIGERIVTHMNGMITPLQKSKLLARFDNLIRACKQARQRANEQDVTHTTLGQDVVEYLLG